MADWIFQANPKRYDVHAAVARSRQDWWNTPRYRDRIAVNDRVWLQIVGPYRPGIYYVATIVSLPYEGPEEQFGPWHTDIRWDFRIDPPLPRPELVNDPALQSFRPFRGFQGSNVPVPPEIAARLSELATPRLVPLEVEKHPSVSDEVEVGAAIERHDATVRQELKRANASVGWSAFVSYSQRDERYRQRLDISLAQLRRNSLISVWHDRKILPGQEWDREIDKNLESADIVLLLVSPDFLASDYAYSREMMRALERHQSGSATVVPIILRPSDWQNSPLGSLQALPNKGRPVSSWPNRDQAWLDVAQGLRRLISDQG